MLRRAFLCCITRLCFEHLNGILRDYERVCAEKKAVFRIPFCSQLKDVTGYFHQIVLTYELEHYIIFVALVA